MKSFIIGLSLLITSVASATEIKILDILADGDQVKTEFAVNKDLGRAWVEVSQEDYSDEGVTIPRRVKVPGLVFNKDSSTIVLTVDGQEVECANVVTWGRSIFRKTKIQNNRCSLSYKHVVVSVDDGFDVSRETRLQVFLSVE